MGSSVVVLSLPGLELPREVCGAVNLRPAIEFVFVRSVAALDLSVTFGASRWDVSVRDSEVPQVPSEVGPELVAVVGLDPLNRHGEPSPNLVHKAHGVLYG